MIARRRLLTTASTVFALAALTACEKPAPIVTVVNAGQSTYAEAVRYCFEDQSLVAGNCAIRNDGNNQLKIVGGQTVGVDVDKDLVDRGWFIELSDPGAADPQQQAPQRSEVQDGHYFTFTAPNLQAGGSLLLTVRSVGATADQTSGEWQFTLVPR